jgi:hypothetical protein
MGLMLESTSPRLRGKGMAHQYAPDKDPAVRLRMHEEAGELRIPFTTGMLLGIGETNAERVDTLLAIRALHDKYGHIQEAIIQPFHPKPGTPMRWASSIPDREIAGWVALARLALGREIDVQAPPNLAPGLLELLLRAGTSDWGGVSPVTVDFINPEAPWPTLRALRERTEAAGQRLVERLPVYPKHLARAEFFAPELRPVALGFSDEDGFARARASLPGGASVAGSWGSDPGPRPLRARPPDTARTSRRTRCRPRACRAATRRRCRSRATTTTWSHLRPNTAPQPPKPGLPHIGIPPATITATRSSSEPSMRAWTRRVPRNPFSLCSLIQASTASKSGRSIIFVSPPSSG